jgi:hypothetical protein
VIWHRIEGVHPHVDYEPTPGYVRWHIGIDFAARRDFTAIVAVQETVQPGDTWDRGWKQVLLPPKRVVRLAQRLRRGIDYTAIRDHIVELARHPSLVDASVWADQTGVGLAVISMLREQGVALNGVIMTGGDRPSQPAHDEWRVPKSVLIETLNVAMSSGELRFAHDLKDLPALRQQMADFQVELTQSGRLTANAVSGSHDDYVIALALTTFGMQQMVSLGAPVPVRW